MENLAHPIYRVYRLYDRYKNLNEMSLFHCRVSNNIPRLQWFHSKPVMVCSPSLTGSNRRQLCQQLAVLVIDSDLGETLQSVHEDDCEEMYRRYLHDFVRSVHRCSHKTEQLVTDEYKVCTCTYVHVALTTSMYV